MEDKRVLVIGIGRHARANIYPALAQASAQIEAVASRHRQDAAAFAQGLGADVRAYGDHRQMLEQENAKRVVVVTQGPETVAVVADCLAAGRTVFAEKPLGLSAAQAQKIVSAAAASGGAVQVGFMKRYAPCYQMLRERIAAGDYGPVRSFRFTFDVSAAAFCRTDRDFIYYVAIHGLDLMRYLFGEITQTAAFKNGAGSGASYQVLLRTESGCTGSCGFENRAAHTLEQERLEVTFEDGYACAENLGSLLLRRAGTGDWRELGESERRFSATLNPGSGAARDLYLRGFAQEMQRFLSDEAADGSADNLRTAQLCDAILADIGAYNS
ncbi:MAG: Gfo/Idh/MocA family oxidoreductase [Oscillospiraceae bacterium]|nr:Gfo/Idh/MocA family oxidoreductase [Oscillospiraceae bacterium]